MEAFSTILVYSLYALKVVLDAFRNAIEPVFRPIARITSVLAAPFLKLPIVKRLVSKMTVEDVPAWLEKKALEIRPTIESDEDLLVHGKLREYAERVAPKEKYPELYCEVPSDLKRSIVADGRTLHGKAPAMALAGTTVNEELITEAFEVAKTDAKFWAITAAAFGLICSALYIFVLSAVSNMASKKAAANAISEGGWDQWPGMVSPAVAAAERSAAIYSASATVAVIAGFVLSMLLAVIVVAIGAVGIGRVIWWLRFAGLVETAINQATAPLRAAEAEAKERWRYRLDARDIETTAYRKALKYIETIDHSPTISWGQASGAFAYRGGLGSPEQDQEVRSSLTDLTQHVLITGASGEGKTREVLKPIMRNLVRMRKSGLPLAMFVMDDKSVLWPDFLIIAEEYEMGDQVRIIGTADEHWRVDLLAGTPPSQVAEIVQSVSKQMAGDAAASDSFWPDMASQLILEISTLLHAHQYTNAGREWSRTEGIRVYSLRNVLRVAQCDSLIHQVIGQILEALNDDMQYQNLAQEDGLALWSAIDAQLQSWTSLAEATKTGVLANARICLRLFAFNPVIARGFGDGSGPNLMTPADLHGNHLTAVAISALEHGSAGRLVLVALKTLLFRQARTLEALDRDFAAARLEWWRNPDPATADPSKSITFFIADEYQGLVTKKEDEEFAAVARSTGTALILATQSISAIETVIGHKSTLSLVNNLRTKIFLRGEDPPTFEYVRDLAGSARRGFASNTYHAESFIAAMREWGISAENLQVASIKTLREIAARATGTKRDANFLFSFLTSARVDSVAYSQLTCMRDAEFSGPCDLRIADAGTFKDIQVDGEIKNRGYGEHMRRQRDQGGMNDSIDWREVDVIAKQDIMQMGRGRAVIFAQRGGITRADIIELNT